MAAAQIPFTNIRVVFEPSNAHWLLRGCGRHGQLAAVLGAIACTATLVPLWDMPNKLTPLKHLLQAATAEIATALKGARGVLKKNAVATSNTWSIDQKMSHPTTRKTYDTLSPVLESTTLNSLDHAKLRQTTTQQPCMSDGIRTSHASISDMWEVQPMSTVERHRLVPIDQLYILAISTVAITVALLMLGFWLGRYSTQRSNRITTASQVKQIDDQQEKTRGNQEVLHTAASLVKSTHNGFTVSGRASDVLSFPPTSDYENPQLEPTSPARAWAWWRGQCFLCDHWYLDRMDSSVPRPEDAALIAAHHDWHLKWHLRNEPWANKEVVSEHAPKDRNEHRGLDSLRETYHHTDHGLKTSGSEGSLANNSGVPVHNGVRTPTASIGIFQKVDEGDADHGRDQELLKRIGLGRNIRGEGEKDGNMHTGTLHRPMIRPVPEDQHQQRLRPQVIRGQGKTEKLTNQKSLVKRTGQDDGKQTQPKPRFRAS